MAEYQRGLLSSVNFSPAQAMLANSPAVIPRFRPSRLAYGIAIFASAFLLFQVEPIIAKMILPWFGGVAAVWAASLFALRIVPRDSWKPAGPEHPAMRILFVLCATVGIPFFLLPTTSPLLQAWYAKASAGTRPYRFYALSNAGSLLGLVSYPILIEPWISASHQALGWSAAYVGVVLLCAGIALIWRGSDSTAATGVGNVPAPTAGSKAVTTRVPAGLRLLWLGLAACSSALLLAVTNHITQNIASVPFLWILPLSLYLLSFILCFDARGWYRRGLFLRLLGIAIGGMVYALAPSFAGLPWKVMLAVFCAGFFLCCMFCHGELERLKPAPEHLTVFYLMIALGSAIGAAFVALVAPQIFSGYYEMHVGLGLCAILVLVVHSRDEQSRFYARKWNAAWLVLAALVLAVIASLFVTAREQGDGTRVMSRNFYGVLRVIDAREPNVVFSGEHPQWDRDPRFRKLMNGTIDHGLQFLNPARDRDATTYYGANSGIGVTLQAAGRVRALRVGAIGLGIGTVATYGRAGDSYTFYEINPLVVKLAQQQFTFLRDSRAKIDIVLGDARLSLEREVPQNFDVLIVDAFSGDSIPVHLLTRQAFQLYFRHLKTDGVLAVHVSNQYLNLVPVVAAAASDLGKEAVIVNHEVGVSAGVYPSTWILVGRRKGFLGRSEIEKAGEILPSQARPSDLWTDDYSSLWRVLK